MGTHDTRVYTYDQNGNLKRGQSLPQDVSYTYDAMDKLTREQGDVGEVYTYDQNGNRTSADGKNYAYAANSNRLTRFNGNDVTTDPAGNILHLTEWNYLYNNAGRLHQVKNGNTLKGTYTYNYLNLRTRKVAGTVTTIFHYDLTGTLIGRTDSNGQKAWYLYADDQPIAQIAQASSGVETLVYIHVDHLNTPRLATNHKTTPKVAWRLNGDAFGFADPKQNPDGDNITTVIDLRFPGQYYDPEGDFVYNWNRYYKPRIGRYLTSDPIGLEGGLNTYGYVGGNPLSFIDQDGLKIICWPWGCKGDHNLPPTDRLPPKDPSVGPPKTNRPKCVDSTTDFVNCMSCCSTPNGYLASGGGSTCQEQCMQKQGITQAPGSQMCKVE